MNLDYSALNQPISKDDFKKLYAWNGFHDMKFIHFVMIVVGLWGFLLMFSLLALGGVSDANQFTLIVAIVFTVAAIQITFQRLKLRRWVRLYKFAAANHISLSLDASLNDMDGMIFKQGHSGVINELLTLNQTIRVGNYTYTEGHGKRSRDYKWGFMHVKLTRNLPHMMLDAKRNNLFGLISSLPRGVRGQKVSLEGDFNDYFTLYAPKKYERDALYVFTPDVMAAVIDAGKAYDIEIIDDTLVLWSRKQLSLASEKELTKLIAIAEKIGKEVSDQTKRYSDTHRGQRAANTVARPARRLKTKINFGRVLLGMIVAILIFLFLFYFNTLSDYFLR